MKEIINVLKQFLLSYPTSVSRIVFPWADQWFHHTWYLSVPVPVSEAVSVYSLFSHSLPTEPRSLRLNSFLIRTGINEDTYPRIIPLFLLYSITSGLHHYREIQSPDANSSCILMMLRGYLTINCIIPSKNLKIIIWVFK